MNHRLRAAFGLLFLASACRRGEILRDEVAVDVNDARERWSLVWLTPPRPVCMPEDATASTCPCTGFAYGEAGTLDLVRERPGQSVERLHLTPLFAGEDSPVDDKTAVLQRSPVLDGDYPQMDSAEFGSQIRGRPPTRAIAMQDYDHDGRATEFLLQVGELQCGKRESVVVGISKSNPTLHVFTSVAHPKEPLVLEAHIWNELLRSSGKVESVEWACGDHGADTLTLVRLSISAAGIDGVRSEYECKADDTAGKLISSAPI